jgi:hypothetical protein
LASIQVSAVAAVEVLGPERLPDLDHQHAAAGEQAVGDARPLRQGSEPLDGGAKLAVAEHADRTRQHEGEQPGGLPDPSDVGHDGASVEEAQRGEPQLRVLPRGTRGEPLELGADLVQQAEAAPLPPGAADEGTEHLLVVLFRNPADRPHAVDPAGKILDSLQHDHTPFIGLLFRS